MYSMMLKHMTLLKNKHFIILENDMKSTDTQNL